MTDPGKLARVIIAVVTGLYTFVLFLTGNPLEHGARQAVSYVPTFVGFGVILFDVWLWRCPGVHFFVGRPRIDGTWLATLQPSADSHIPEGGNRGPIEAAVVIEQTYWSLAATLMTKESTSQSYTASLRADAESRGRRLLTYSYGNVPEQAQRPRSQPHLGATQLRVTGRLPTELTGSYWTDRLTRGDMRLTFFSRERDYPTLDAVLKAGAKVEQIAATKAATSAIRKRRGASWFRRLFR
jgi:hypothetical protein